MRGLLTLGSLLAPGALFAACLALAHAVSGEFAWLGSPRLYPWELWAVAAFGVLATAGGLGDWWYHRRHARVGSAEHRGHLLALATGGIPMFLLMVGASLSERPSRWLLPILAVLIYTVVLICHDEFVFHRRRCGALETLFHRLLVLGNGTAWLSWMHWCFSRGVHG